MKTLTPAGSPAPAGRIGAAKQGWELGRELWNLVRDRLTWSVSIDEDDPLFDPVLDWAVGLVHAAKSQRTLRVVSGHTKSDDNTVAVDGSSRRAPWSIRLLPDRSGTTTVDVDGHRVDVSLSTENASDQVGGRRDRDRMPPVRLVFRVYAEAARDAVVARVRDIAAQQSERRPVLRTVTSWGGWSTREDVPLRSVESVVLRPGVMEGLIVDLQRFLDSEKQYARRGIPYHRNYLLHGQPGVGKSSVVQALASHFGLDLWYVALADLRQDSNLSALLSDIHPRSIVLLEDIDRLGVSQGDDSDHVAGAGVSASGLLNALDGVTTPHGAVTFLTANDPSLFDGALTRPGRVDRRVEFVYADDAQVARLWRWFYELPADKEPPDLPNSHLLWSPSAVVESFKRHPDDSYRGIRELYAPSHST